jgi:tetratricopeptide (TPR) repeat protein
VLDARTASAAGNRNAAIELWKKAVAAQDQLNYDEPPAWYYPVRESLGGEYLRAQRFADAERVFRRDLEINPQNPRSLFGLQEALRGQSKDANDVSRRFTEAWKDTGIQLTVDGL